MNVRSICSLAVASLALIAFAGPAAAEDVRIKPRSPFAGTWVGKMTPSDDQEGELSWTIDDEGYIVGEAKNNKLNATATAKGTVDEDGRVKIVFEFPTQTVTAHGTVSRTAKDGLTGTMSQRVGQAIGSIEFDLRRKSNPFAGAWVGKYTVTMPYALEPEGVLSGTIDQKGNITGMLINTKLKAPAIVTGTVDEDGKAKLVIRFLAQTLTAHGTVSRTRKGGLTGTMTQKVGRAVGTIEFDLRLKSNPFAGDWVGKFIATNPNGSEQEGELSGTIDEKGNVKGKLKDNTLKTTATMKGTVDEDGKVKLAAMFLRQTVTGEGTISRTRKGDLTGTMTRRIGMRALGSIEFYIKPKAKE